MQYNIKLTTTQGVKAPGKNVDTIDQFMSSNEFTTEPTIKDIKDFAKITQLRSYTPQEINSESVLINGKEVTDDNTRVSQRVSVNYVLNIK